MLNRYDLFVGLATYYRRSISGFSKIAGPLFALTLKDSLFEWPPSCQQAFERLKQLLTTASILIFPDFTKRFILETDATGVGLGGVVSQKQLNGQIAPIAYVSQTLQQHETKYGISALTVVRATKHFRVY